MSFQKLPVIGERWSFRVNWREDIWIHAVKKFHGYFIGKAAEDIFIFIKHKNSKITMFYVWKHDLLEKIPPKENSEDLQFRQIGLCGELLLFLKHSDWKHPTEEEIYRGFTKHKAHTEEIEAKLTEIKQRRKHLFDTMKEEFVAHYFAPSRIESLIQKHGIEILDSF